MDSPYAALTVVLFGLAALFTWAAANSWLQLSRHRGVEFPAARFRSAAVATALALAMIGAALLWSALQALGTIPPE